MDYFEEDLPAIKEQCFLMVKTRMEDLAGDIIENEDIGPLENNQEKLDEFAGNTMDEMIDLATIKGKEGFDNPFVMSFLANTAGNNSFVPNGYFTQFEFQRLTFNSLGQISTPDEDSNTSLRQLIGGGLILARYLIKEVFFNSRKYFTDNNYSDNGEGNMEAVGIVIYNALMGAFREELNLEPDEGNVEVIYNQDDQPYPMDGALGFKEENDGEEEDPQEIISSVPDAANYPHDEDTLRDKVLTFLGNIAAYIQMQIENEKLPQIKRLIEAMQEIAKKIKSADPELSNSMLQEVQYKQQQYKF